jgi:hypothetical protein
MRWMDATRLQNGAAQTATSQPENIGREYRSQPRLVTSMESTATMTTHAVYFKDQRGWRTVAILFTRDEARHLAAAVAELPYLWRKN